MTTLFAKIIRGDISSDTVYRDELVTAFRDIAPAAPTHVLIVPNKEIPTLNDAKAEDKALLGHMMLVAAEVARQEGVDQDGYRLILNCNRDAGQEVLHLHLHLLGGRPLGPLLKRD